ncbi:MAG: C25 family cysteine peptidase [Candidatus Aenigmatarchaeota archaeon]
MEAKTIFLITITLVFIVVSLSLLVTMSGVSKNLPSFLRDFTESIYSLIFRSPYNICEAYQDKKVSYEEFKTLLVAIKKGSCKNVSATVKLTFSLSKDDIKKLPKEIGISKEELVFFGKEEPMGVGGIIVKGNPGEYPIKMDDKIEISAKGYPEEDIIIKVKEKGCDPFDDVCDLACSYKRGVCDPLCYRDGKKEDVVCDIDCVDKNKNGKIDADDLDGVCDLDCYNNFKNPEKAYDPDCALLKINNPTLASSYGLVGVCDPDSNGVSDGICDPDCAKDNFICDPDCDGVVSSSNPLGLKDNDCYTCDKTCNGFCAMACSASDKDPDCPYGFIDWNTLEECCGNGICGKDEDCESCSKDCPSGNTCEDFGKVCCPKASDRDDYGCSAKKNLSEGEECGCDSQCNATLLCTSGHCCPANSFWNGTACSNRTDVLIVALKANMKKVYSDDQIKQLEDKIKEFIQTLNKYDSLGGIFLYLDEDQTKDIIGTKVTKPNDWNDINGVLDQLIPKLEAKYLIILGGYERFPQALLSTTIDEIFGIAGGSDAPYGDINKDGRYIIDIPIGRIPDPNKGDMEVMLKTLETSINLHKSGGISLKTYIAPIMACGGYDNRNWNSGKCFCQYIWSSSCQPCGSCCGCIQISPLSGKDFVMVLAHGPGPVKEDYLRGGCLQETTATIRNIDVSNSFWMSMACGGAHIRFKESVSDSIMMTFLKNGGAIFIGSTNLNYGGLGSTCPVPGGDECIGTFYALVAKRLEIGKRIGDIYLEGKNEYYNKYKCPWTSREYHYHINHLYGDPTLKIKEMW